MSTSLAEQLRRLAAPQTSILVDSKKRASILFDPKEAANKDRSTIYEIGYKGLMDLAALNPAFLQFEQTLFDRTTLQFERSVETDEVNRQLNKTIRRFFYHLSPYFMLQPAHMCLEWLLRRYHIHQFNKPELLQLIFPYHETKIFVRCIQVMRLKNTNDGWDWLVPIQRAGVPLSKSAVLNRTASDQAFLKFICKSTVEAIKELDTQANALQAQIAFYCTTVIGGLEYAQQITEWHVSTILSSILKGLASRVLDFCAAAYMISAQLVAKSTLSSKLLEAMIGKICNVEHVQLQRNAVTLLVLIFQNQSENIKAFPEEMLVVLVEHEWLPAAIDVLVQQGIIVGAFCNSIVGECLQRVQSRGAGWQKCRSFLENSLLVAHLRSNDAQSFIKCALYNYSQQKPQTESNEVIELDSGDENDEFMLDKDVQSWYSGFLQSLERQYPAEFESTLKEIMQGRSGVSESRRIALKAALAFRLKSLYTDDNVAIYEHLYHYNSRNRAEAVRFLVNNFQKLAVTQHDDGLLKDSLLDRLSDEDPKVLIEILALPTEVFVRTLGHDATVSKLIEIFRRRRKSSEKWQKVCSKALEHLTKRSLWNKDDSLRSRILLAVTQFLFPVVDGDVALTRQILSSELGKSVDVFKSFLNKANSFDDPEKLAEMMDATLPTSTGMMQIENLLEAFTDCRDAVWFLFLLRSCYRSETDASVGQKTLNAIMKIQKECSFAPTKAESKWYQVESPLSLQLFLDALKTVADRTQLTAHDFYSIHESKSLLLRIFELLLTKAFSSRPADGKVEYTDTLKHLLNSAFPEIAEKLNFLANYFVADHVRSEDEDLEVQIRAMKLFCVAAGQATEVVISNQSTLKVLIALSSPVDFVRECAVKALEILNERNLLNAKFANVAQLIVDRTEQILLDHEQFPLVFFTISSKSKSNKINVIDDLIAIAIDPGTEVILKVGALNIIKHINNLTVFKKILQIGREVLEYIDRLGDGSDGFVVLDKYRSKIVRFIALRIELATVKVLNEDETAWDLIQKLLEGHRVMEKVEGKQIALASVVMDAFFEELYEKMSGNRKKQLIDAVINTLTFGNDNSLVSSGNKLVKRITLDGKHVAAILTKMTSTCVSGVHDKIKINLASTEIFAQADWKRGITLLELLQNKRKLDRSEVLVTPLIELLKKCLEFEEQSTFEYAKQLILSSLLLCSQKLLHNNAALKTLPENAFRIDLIVECIRATQNPQTHHHALLLLVQCASLFPQDVLHHIMGIFTFVGTSVVRHDDAFSFQIITKIIESIIPTLVSGQADQRVVPVLRMFSDIVLDVPEHRRMTLYAKLVRTLDAEKHLWQFLCVLLEAHVKHDDTEKAQRQRYTKGSNEIPQRVEFGLQLIKDFDVAKALTTCIRLFEYLAELPMDKEAADGTLPMDVDSAETVLFDLSVHSAKQLRHFKYVLVQVVSNFTSSMEFLNQIAALDDEETKAMKPLYQEFIIKILCYVPHITRAMEKNSTTNQLQYWKVMLHNCYDVLENAISLLSPDMLLVVVNGLMQHKLSTVRKKVIEILIAKLQYKGDYFANCNEEHLLNLLPSLNDILDTILDKEQAAPTNEIIFIQQIALIALKLLSRIMGLKHVEQFKEILQKLTRILKKRNMVPKIILATVVLAITEISSNLKAQAISQLSKFMPYIIEVLQDQAEYLTNQPTDNVTIAIVTSVQKLFDSLPLFLGSYMTDILLSLTTLWVRLGKYDEEPRTNVVFEKLKATWSKIATTIPLRVVVPICDKTYRKLVDDQQFGEIEYLVKLLNECFETASASEDVQNLQAELSEFYLHALEFRVSHLDQMNRRVMRRAEESIVESFVSLVLKLSESSFRPLYQKLYNWALRKTEEKDRALTFFIVSGKIAESLKSLFVLFASDFIKDAADLLDKCNSSKTEDLYFPDADDRNKILVGNILKTLYEIFLHDSKDFINEHRFDILMQPVVDQLQNRMILDDDSMKMLLISCIAQLAHVVRNDTLWKRLNYEVLLKTRNNSPEIRIGSLNCCVEIVRKLGEQFIPLLPETVPFIAELFEDENEQVEKSCKRGVQEMEKLLGVSMQEYF